MKKIFTFLSLGWKYFICLRVQNDEPLYSQYFKSKIANKIFESVSEDLSVKGNICDVFGAHVECLSKERRLQQKEYGPNFYDFCEIEFEKKEKNIKHQLCKLTVQKTWEKLLKQTF